MLRNLDLVGVLKYKIILEQCGSKHEHLLQFLNHMQVPHGLCFIYLSKIVARTEEILVIDYIILSRRGKRINIFFCQAIANALFMCYM